MKIIGCETMSPPIQNNWQQKLLSSANTNSRVQLPHEPKSSINQSSISMTTKQRNRDETHHTTQSANRQRRKQTFFNSIGFLIVQDFLPIKYILHRCGASSHRKWILNYTFPSNAGFFLNTLTTIKLSSANSEINLDSNHLFYSIKSRAFLFLFPTQTLSLCILLSS